MPTTTTLELAPHDLMKGDVIYSIPMELVVSGRSFAEDNPIVASKKLGQKNFTVETHLGKMLIKATADPVVVVQREVPTQDEIDAKNAETLALFRIRDRQDLFNKGCKSLQAYHNAAIRVAQEASKVGDGRLGHADEIARYAMDLIEAEAIYECWANVFFLTGEDGMDIVDATMLYRRRLANILLERGADDGWSGRGNENKRAAFDAKRKWATDFEVKYLAARYTGQAI